MTKGNMITRNVQEELLQWKNRPNKKPLIIRGARQIGKTTLVNQFAKNYKHYLYFNLDLAEDKQLFDTQIDFSALVKAMFLSKGMRTGGKDTLIFIDEIQESPNAIQQLRYFYESDFEVDVIAAGSLLEHVLGDLKSFPVGRVSYLALHPMNFIEYLRGIQSELIGIEDLNALYKGKIIQHLAAQELIANYSKPSFKPAFWAREKKSSNAEIDLILQHGKYLIPIEIKAGKTGRLRSLHAFMDQTNHRYAVRLYKGDFSVDEVKTIEGKTFLLMNLPYFLACKIPQYIAWFVSNY